MLYGFGRFFKRLPARIAAFFAAVGRGAARFFVSIGRGIADLGRIFAQGDAFVKLSFLVMGFGCIVRRQFAKGLLYLAAQVAFIAFFITFGWTYLRDFGTLGTSEPEVIGTTASGLPIYSEPDNSMLILLYSVMTLMLAAAFLALWYANVKSAYEAFVARREGRALPTLRDTLHEMLNRRFHVTLLSLPTILILLFTILPLVFMVLIAFTNYDSLHQPPGRTFSWVGFENFGDILGDNPTKAYTFTHLLQWTLIWAVAATFSNYILGMLLALMINKKGIRFKKVWRTIFVTTIAVPQFVTLLLMSKLLADHGTMQVIVESLGGTWKTIWNNATRSRVAVILINVWVGVPFTMLSCSGVLMNIPKDLYESARIDGASPVETFFKITLPYMLFVTAPNLITAFVGNINNFNVIYLLTQGYPLSLGLYQAGETDLLVTWLYKLTVNYQEYNLASVIGILVFAASAALSLLVYNSSSAIKNEETFQ